MLFPIHGDDMEDANDPERQRFVEMLESKDWTFAKSMPANPHFYTLRWDWENDQDFVDTVLYIRKHGVRELFKRTYYTVFYSGEWKYWTMGAPCPPAPYDKRIHTYLINRAAVPKT